MIDSIIRGFEVWTDAQGVKSKGRVKSIDNISLEGLARLRELILELAIQGKLVSQNQNDTPSIELLKVIKKVNLDLIKEGKLRKIKELPAVEEAEFPFSLPSGWQFVRLNEIGEWGSGSTPNRSNPEYYGGAIPWFKSGELISDFIDTSEEFITEKALKETSVRYNNVGDVLIAMYGATIGKTSILKVKATTNQAVCACTPFYGVENTFLLTLLKAYKNRFIGMGAGGAQPNISRDKIINTVIGLPPTEEQKRIVEKVKELMALCDKLEEEQTKKLSTHQNLVKTLLETLTRANNTDELQSAWEKLSGHFDTLFITEDSIEQLKQAILQMAIMGRLVKQVSKDESAKILLGKIDEVKNSLIENGVIRKQKELDKISEEEHPFALPSGWIFERLNNVLDVRDGTHDSPKDAFGPNTYPLITSKDFKNGKIDFSGARRILEKDHLEISKRSKVEKFDILFSMIGGNLGNQVMVLDEADFSIKNVALLKYYSKELTLPYFIKKYTEHLAYDLQSRAIGGAQPFVSLGSLRNLVIGLPPIEEQKRIVSKVDELFIICDSIKEKITKSESIKSTLSETIVKVLS